MTQQLSLNLSRELTKAGMQQALDNANRVHPKWSDQAYTYLKLFVASRRKGERFLAEDIRQDAETIVPTPPSYRSWGAVVRKAIVEGLIIKVGHKSVKNHRAHRAVANEYVKA